MAKYKFNDDMPTEEAVAVIRAVERYVNAAQQCALLESVLAILGIEKIKEDEE